MSLVIGSNEEIGETLIDNRRIPLISATGSTHMGRGIDAMSASRLSRAILELGGNNAIIVTESADLGLAMVSGSDIALKSADIILVRDDLAVIPDAIGLSRRTLRTIKTNLGWAFGYNIAAIPIAAAGLLNPLIAAGAMALSSVLVVYNSLRLQNFRRTPRR